MRGGRFPTRALLALVLLGVTATSGCFNAVDQYYAFDPDPKYRNPGVFEGVYGISSQSLVLQPGTLRAGQPEVIQLRSERPAYPEQTALVTSDGEVLIKMAIWKPENYSLPMPVIVDAGPYYEYDVHCPPPTTRCLPEQMVPDTIDWPGQSTPFLLKNMLPHGYAVVQLAVRGTGTHGGCMDLMGSDEVADLNQAITWLGEQPWSNGRVAMMGVSYDGSTPWEVAGTGNPYLKTIVPISGLPDIYDLMFHNGSAEGRGATMHNLVYWPFGFDDEFPQSVPDPAGIPLPVQPPVPLPVPVPAKPVFGNANGRAEYQDMQNLLCPSAAKGLVFGPGATVTGNRLGAADPYWIERDHRDDVLNNYTGSVFLIHGLQDWNVDPHTAIPFNLALREKGLEVKEWYGQWQHARPDSNCGFNVPSWATMPCRLDYAEVLYRWFERHLRENMTLDVGPAIQVMDNVGQWRNVDQFPPTDVELQELFLSAQSTLTASGDGPGTAVRLDPSTNGAPAQVIELVGEPLAEDLHLSGMPTMSLPFSTTGEGGTLGVWMFDQDANGSVRAPRVCPADVCEEDMAVGLPVVGHAGMNLLYHAGGEEPQPLVPGERYTAQLQFEPLDVLIPQGHRIVLWIFQYEGFEHTSMSYTPSPIDIYLGGEGAVLRMPALEWDAKQVFPVPGAHFPDREGQLERMYILKPVFPPSSPLPVAVPAYLADEDDRLHEDEPNGGSEPTPANEGTSSCTTPGFAGATPIIAACRTD